jgi:hypothetical protein
VGHLGEREVSENGVLSHFLQQGPRPCNISERVRCGDIPKVCPDPVACRNHSTDFEVLEEDMLEWGDPFMGDMVLISDLSTLSGSYGLRDYGP